jgi:hypothetical protein
MVQGRRIPGVVESRRGFLSAASRLQLLPNSAFLRANRFAAEPAQFSRTQVERSLRRSPRSPRECSVKDQRLEMRRLNAVVAAKKTKNLREDKSERCT